MTMEQAQPGGVSQQYVDDGDARTLAEAKAYADALFAGQPEPPDPEPPEPPAEPVVVHTPADIARWGPGYEYDRLNGKWAGKVGATRPIHLFIPAHGSQERRDNVDSSIIVKCQAALWTVDQNQTRYDETMEDIETFARIPLEWTGDGDSPLSQSWLLENLVTGAFLLGADPAILEPLLRFELEHLSWIQGANWFGSECDAVLQIAYYLNDPVLINDGWERFHFRIGQALYDPDYDGDCVQFLRGANNDEMIWPNCLTATEYANENDNHWNGQCQAPNGLAVYDGVPLPKGCGAERLRDIAHEVMGLYAWANAARTIRANGGIVEAHAHSRIRFGAELLAERVLAFIRTGSVPYPVGTNDNGIGGTGYAMGWQTVATYLGAETPSVVTELLARSEINADAVGTNHQIADAFVR